jgi:hypothetical protein
MSEEEKNNIKNFQVKIKKKSEVLSLTALVKILNIHNNNNVISQMILDEISRKLDGSLFIPGYVAVIENISDTTMEHQQGVRLFATGYLDAMYKTAIKPSNNTIEISNFLSTQGTNLPKELYMDALSDGAKIESKKIDIAMATVDSQPTFHKIWNRIVLGETINTRKNMLLHAYYTEMANAKRNGNMALAMMMWEAISTNKSISGLKSVFDVQRDQELKDFLKDQFERLNQSQNEQADRMIAAVRETNISITNNLAKISQQTDTMISTMTPTEETREEEAMRNYRMAIDMHFADRYLISK